MHSLQITHDLAYHNWLVSCIGLHGMPAGCPSDRTLLAPVSRCNRRCGVGVQLLNTQKQTDYRFLATHSRLFYNFVSPLPLQVIFHPHVSNFLPNSTNDFSERLQFFSAFRPFRELHPDLQGTMAARSYFSNRVNHGISDLRACSESCLRKATKLQSSGALDRLETLQLTSRLCTY